MTLNRDEMKKEEDRRAGASRRAKSRIRPRGTLKMNRKIILSFLFLIIISSLMHVPLVAAQEETTLSYDDGIPEAGGHLWEGWWVKVVFEPPWPCQILEIQVYSAQTVIHSDPGDAFDVVVFDEDAQKPVLDFAGYVTTLGWDWVAWDIRDERVGVNDDFSIQLGCIGKKFSPGTAGDTSNPDGRSYFKEPGVGWKVMDSDVLIRVKVRPLDADGDGLKVWEEEDLGTDPNKADTDGDGLDDKKEIDVRTDPLKPDTDGDGWSDSTEVNLSQWMIFNPTNSTLPNFAIIGILVLIILVAVVRRRRPPPPAYPPAPPPPAVAAPICPVCGTQCTWVPQYSRWYCQKCRQYR